MESLIQIRAKVDGGNACPRATDPGCAGKQHGKKRAPGEMCPGCVWGHGHAIRPEASLDISGPWCSS